MPTYFYRDADDEASDRFDAPDDDAALAYVADLLEGYDADPADVATVWRCEDEDRDATEYVGEAHAPDTTAPTPEEAKSWRITGVKWNEDLGQQRFPTREDAELLRQYQQRDCPFSRHGIQPSSWPPTFTLLEWLDYGCGVTGPDAAELIDELRAELARQS